MSQSVADNGACEGEKPKKIYAECKIISVSVCIVVKNWSYISFKGALVGVLK